MNASDTDRIMAAQAGRKCPQCSKNEIGKTITDLYLHIGYDKDKWNVKEVDYLSGYIKDHFREDTLMELSLALEFYSQNKFEKLPFNQFIKICAAFLDQLMFAYKEMRYQARRDTINLLPEHQINPDEIAQLRKFYNISFFNKYRDQGILHIPGKLTYDYLKGKGLIMFTPAREKEIEAESKKPAKKTQVGEYFTDDRYTVLVKAFYDDLIETETELADLLN